MFGGYSANNVYLTVTANPAEGGTINPGGGEFEEGTDKLEKPKHKQNLINGLQLEIENLSLLWMGI